MPHGQDGRLVKKDHLSERQNPQSVPKAMKLRKITSGTIQKHNPEGSSQHSRSLAIFIFVGFLTFD